ncbi:MAG: cob(I)yrinic acid a,c-diamide adenosyltransferase [Candidatus Magasanikbacteria bacterium]|nr:cob(I)yrinic acid a,c-diamide adenosyltransferase [Candidatus Magasanikbacteria bacterium]
MKIYTKTGDKGETSLLGGKRVSKSCVEMQVIGEVDELNASLGLVVAHLSFVIPTEVEESLKQKRERSLRSSEDSVEMTNTLINFIQNIQRDLFKFGAELAALQGPLEGSIEKIDDSRVKEMEVFIDQFWNELPPLRNFILPGGSLAGAQLHMARTICRRAERQLVGFSKTISVRTELNIYLNRLSDFLFAAARYVNFKEGAQEIIV